jgi:Flp pilus assembly pilin Flp
LSKPRVPRVPVYSNQEVLEEKPMKKFLLDDTGLELSEYAVAAALIAIAVVGAFNALGSAIGERLNLLVTRVSG